MTKPTQSQDTRSKAEDAPDKAGRIPWLLIGCVILIIVTVAAIVNELAT